MAKFQKITACLWFNNNAEEAVNYYRSIFKKSRVIETSYYTEAGKEIHGHNAGDVLTIVFKLEDQQFIALNGGDEFKFNEAISLQLLCDTQKEIDYYWNHLTEDGGEESVCGWLKDKYGVSWQITPSVLPTLLSDKEKADMVMRALFQMKKIDIKTLKQAYANQLSISE